MITSYEILDFLREHRVYEATESECRRLVKFFDLDEDGGLSNEEYVKFIIKYKI